MGFRSKAVNENLFEKSVKSVNENLFERTVNDNLLRKKNGQFGTGGRGSPATSARRETRTGLPRLHRRGPMKIHPGPLQPRPDWGGMLEPRVPGRVAPGDCSPGAPADPYLHFRAYGSSYH